MEKRGDKYITKEGKNTSRERKEITRKYSSEKDGENELINETRQISTTAATITNNHFYFHMYKNNNKFNDRQHQVW